MKRNIISVFLIMFIFSIITFGQARLQVIHNSADVAATSVDVYLMNINSTAELLKLDDFTFRTASPFVDVPAGVDLGVVIAAPTSTGPTDGVITTFDIGQLDDLQKYVVFANGVVDSSLYSPNPDGNNISFELLVKSMVREEALNNENVDFFVLHGSTDAPTVDVIARDVATLVDDAPYSAITNYIEVPAAKYILDITPGSDNETLVASFEADLSSLAGGTAVVFASGFLDPASNQNGEAFGLYAALTDGTVVEFPAYVPQARLQVIHNSADLAASIVDIYLLNVSGHGIVTKLDDFAFRSASPFVDVPANVNLEVVVASSGSIDEADQVVTTIPVGPLNEDESYVAIANGVIDPSAYASNPEEISTAFELLIKPMASEKAISNNVEFFVLHGATDAPTVDIIARDVATLVDDAPYKAITDYIEVPANKYILDVTPGSDNETVVASFNADLSGLGGGSAVVFASGFLDPSSNQNGEAFGLFAALADGNVVEFPAYVPQARLQVIHNAADVAAASVDIYLWNTANDSEVIKLDDFAFRTATPFVDVPAGDSLDVIIAAPSSTSETDAVIATIPVGALVDMENYVLFANGVLDPSTYAANPDGISTAFELLVKPMAREEALGDDVEFFVLHGATDAPTVDVIARDVATLVDDAPYKAMTNYIEVPANSYILDVTPGSDNQTIVASFNADLSTLAGGSAVIFASGFFDPSSNQNGQAFGLFAALADGNVVEFSSVVTDINENLSREIPTKFELKQNYPNPFNPSTIISFSLPKAENVKVKIYNILGKEVASLLNDQLSAGIYNVNFDATNLASGTYFYRIETASFTQVKKMNLIK